MGRLKRNHEPSGRRNTAVAIVGAAVAIAIWIAVIVALGRVGSGNAENAQRGGPQKGGRNAEAPASKHNELTTAKPSSPSDEGATTGIRAEGEKDFVSTPQSKPRQSSEDDSVRLAKPNHTLSTTEKERARLAAAEFIAAAYGYSGDSEKEYRDGVTQTTSTSLYNSPGGKRIDDYAHAAGKEGMQSVAKLEGFEVTEARPEEVESVAHFVAGEGGDYDRYGRISGKVSHFSQVITLVPAGEGFRVRTASVEKEIRDDPRGEGEG